MKTFETICHELRKSVKFWKYPSYSRLNIEVRKYIEELSLIVIEDTDASFLLSLLEEILDALEKTHSNFEEKKLIIESLVDELKSL